MASQTPAPKPTSPSSAGSTADAQEITDYRTAGGQKEKVEKETEEEEEEEEAEEEEAVAAAAVAEGDYDADDEW